MPRPVVPIFSLASRARSSSLWNGRVKCARSDTYSLCWVRMPRWLNASSSVNSVSGSSTTPLPTRQIAPWIIPEGIWWSTNSPAAVCTVCPALAPPWYRTTRSARSARTSTILPLPSSPHWAPTTTTHWVFGPNTLDSPDGNKKAPAAGAKVPGPCPGILCGKLSSAQDARQPCRDVRGAIEPQPGDRVVGPVHNPHRAPVALHDLDTLPGNAAERNAVDNDRQPAPPPRVYGIRHRDTEAARPMHERSGSTGIVEAVEVDDAGLGEQVAPLEG